MLNKRLTNEKDKLTIAYCQNVNKSRTIDKFMEFNYLYFFDEAKVTKNRKAVDDMIPFEFFIDLTFGNQKFRRDQPSGRK